LDEQSEAKEAFYYQLARSKSRTIPCNCSSSDKTEPPYPTLLLPGKTRPPGTSISPQNPSPSPLLRQNYSHSETWSYPAVYPDATIRMGIHPINGPPEPSGQTEDMLYQPFKSETTTASPAGSCNTIPDILLASIHPGTFPSGRDFFYATHTLPELYAGVPENTAAILFFQGSHPANSSGAQQTIDLTCPDDISTYTDINTCESYISGNLDPLFDEETVVRLTWEMTGATEDASPPQGIHRLESHTFSEGHTTVTYTATASDGSTATCSFSVTISDNQVPRLENMPPDITVAAAPGECFATVFWMEPTATDNCTPAYLMRKESNYRPGDVFPVGATRVYYTAYDAMGNESTVEWFTVTVEDRQPPVLTLPPDLTVQCGDPLPAPWTTLQQLTAAGGSATDNCTLNETSFRLHTETPSSTVCPYALTRIYLITDASGNFATAEHRIMVEGEGPGVEAATQQELGLKSGMATFTAIQSGPWSDTDTWGGSGPPTASDDVIIPTGITVTANDITIDGSGSITLEDGAALEVAGNWTNNGSFSAGTNSTVTFTGTSDATISGNSPTTFNQFILDKGTDVTSELEINSVGTVSFGNYTFTSGLLVLTTGTYTLGSNFDLVKATGIHVNGATLNTGDFSIGNQGLIKISAGTANFGNSTGNSIETSVDGAFVVTGGTVNIAGRLHNSAGGTLVTGINSGIEITGGTINLSTVGNGLSSTGALNVTAQGAFRFTGGTITIENANTTTGTVLDIGIADVLGDGTKTITNGVFQLGAGSASGETFVISSLIPLTNIETANNANIVLSNDLEITNQLALNGTSRFILNGFAAKLPVASFSSYIFYGEGILDPITIDFTGGTFSGATLEVKVVEAVHPNNQNSNYYLEKHWNIQTTGITNPQYDVDATFLASDIANSATNLIAANYSSSTWNEIAGATIGGNSVSFGSTSTNLSFSVLEEPTVTITNLDPEEICDGNSVQLATTATGDPVLTYFWSSSPSTTIDQIPSPTVSPPANPSNSVTNYTYTVTVTDGNGFTASDDITITVNPLPNRQVMLLSVMTAQLTPVRPVLELVNLLFGTMQPREEVLLLHRQAPIRALTQPTLLPELMQRVVRVQPAHWLRLPSIRYLQLLRQVMLLSVMTAQLTPVRPVLELVNLLFGTMQPRTFGYQSGHIYSLCCCQN